MDEKQQVRLSELRQHFAVLRGQKEEIWKKLVAFDRADILSGEADHLFSMSLQVDISLVKAYSLKVRIEDGRQLPKNEDADPEALLQRVRETQDALASRFQAWKEGGPALSFDDYAPWREALSAYCLVAPDDVIGFSQGHESAP